MLRAIFLGHAGLFLSYGSVSILMDPWFSDKGAFLGSWRQWPRNDHVPSVHPEILNPSHLWISHEHPDHFDADFLQSVNKSATVLSPRFPSPRLKLHLQDLGFSRFVSLDHTEQVALSDQVLATMLMEYPAFTEHSSLHIQAGGIGILHNSDTSFSPDETAELSGFLSTDLYVGQYSITSPFPDVMDWSEEDKQPHRIKHLEWAMDRFATSVRGFRASHAIPCAGPAVIALTQGEDPLQLAAIIDPDGGYNSERLFNTLSRETGSCVHHYLEPGQDFSWSYGEKPVFAEACHWNEGQRALEYREIAAAAEFRDASEAPDWQELLGAQRSLLQRMIQYCPAVFAELDVFWILEFSDHARGLMIDLSGNTPRLEEVDTAHVAVAPESAFWRLRVDSGIWLDFLKSRIVFDEISYSRRYTVSQSETGFDPTLIELLRASHDDRLLRALNSFQIDNDRNVISVQWKGCEYRIKALCPHLGLSLKGCQPDENGIITCKGHGWRFDVVTGECVFGDRRANIRITEDD